MYIKDQIRFLLKKADEQGQSNKFKVQLINCWLENSPLYSLGQGSSLDEGWFEKDQEMDGLLLGSERRKELKGVMLALCTAIDASFSDPDVEAFCKDFGYDDTAGLTGPQDSQQGTAPV